MRLRPALATWVLGLLLMAAPASAEVYRWVDENGELHFTSDLHQVPPAYRDRTTAPRADEKSTLNVAPASDDPDPDPQSLREQRMRNLRRHNASGAASQARPRKTLDEAPASPAPAAAAPRKYDRDCQRLNSDGRCKSKLNRDWVRWNQERKASEPAAED